MTPLPQVCQFIRPLSGPQAGRRAARTDADFLQFQDVAPRFCDDAKCGKQRVGRTRWRGDLGASRTVHPPPDQTLHWVTFGSCCHETTAILSPEDLKHEKLFSYSEKAFSAQESADLIRFGRSNSP